MRVQAKRSLRRATRVRLNVRVRFQAKAGPTTTKTLEVSLAR